MANNIRHSQKVEERCKVCGSELSNGVCATCGWVQIIFPSEVPSEISDFNERREEMAKKLLEEGKGREAELNKIKGKNSEFNEDLKVLQVKYDSSKEAWEDQKKKLSGENAKLINEINVTKDRLEEMQQEIHRLREENNKAKAVKPMGIVRLVNKKSDDVQILPFYKGINTFGTSPTNDSHQQVRIETFSAQIAPVHFEINTVEHSYVVLKNRTLTKMIRGISGQDVPAEGLRVNIRLGKVIIQDEIELEIETFKS